MQLFYDPDLHPGLHQLRDAEARHAFQVLRKKVGDTIDLVNGVGGWYKAEVTEISKRSCFLEAKEIRQEANRAAHRLHLYVAPTKNIDRFEWILEKATEIGVDFIQPILSEHSERKRIRNDRLERILEAAMKQSLRAWMPTLGELLPFEEALRTVSPNSHNYVAFLGAEGAPLLREVYTPGSSANLFIGPEGGFSPAEAQQVVDVGGEYVSLGPNRLRTETAAIAAVHTIEQLNW